MLIGAADWCLRSDVVTNSRVQGSTGRDGMDLVNCRRVLIEDSRIEGSDDGLCFKTQADAGLGRYIAADVLVRRCYISSECCNAIQFGSRTEVDMRNFTFKVLGLRHRFGPPLTSISAPRHPSCARASTLSRTTSHIYLSPAPPCTRRGPCSTWRPC